MALFDMTASTNVRKLMVLNPEYPKDVTVKAGADAVFSAVIEKDGRPTEYTYKWYVNDVPVDNVNTAVYTRKTDSDKGVYTVYCEITNKAGVVKTRTATLTVNALPKLDSIKPADVSCYIGESKTVSVSISENGYPKSYTYQWYKNGSKISGATGTSYTFTPTTKGTFTFYCEVTNTAGSVNSRTATITVTDEYLYNNGNECIPLTGGWVLESDIPSVYGAATMAKTNTGLNITCTNKKAMFGRLRTVNKIDLTGKTTLSMLVHISTPFVQHRIFATDKYANKMAGFTAEKNFSATASADLTFTLDVSSLNGQYYVGLSMVTADDILRASDITVKEVRIE